MSAIQVTPATMLQIAIEKGADMNQLEKLMDLHERWQAMEAKKAYVTAMNIFKAYPPKLEKTKAVDYSNKSGQKTQYKHLVLSDACNAIGPALSQCGISFTWRTEQTENLIRVTCILTHEMGHSESVSLEAAPDQSGGKNNIQAVGSTVSYLQRYTLLAATGLAPDEADTDGIQEPAQAVSTITAEQAKALVAKAAEAGLTEADVCKIGHVKVLSDLQSSRYQLAMNHFSNLAKKEQSNAA